MKNKSWITAVLFWITAIISIPVGIFVTIICYMSFGLGLYCNAVGMVSGFLGCFAVIVSIICIIIGIIMLVKKKKKKAFIFVLIGIAFSAICTFGLFIDEAIDTVQMKKAIAERENQLYGENWNSPSVLEGIPEKYQTKLNKYYVAVRDSWDIDKIYELEASSMPNYYGDASLDNIGFAIIDLNDDGTDELIIGTAKPVSEAGTAIFCIYSNPENPTIALSSVEEQTYYLHYSESDGIYIAETEGSDLVWRLEPYEGDEYLHTVFDEIDMDPAGRLTLEMIPFSEYK